MVCRKYYTMLNDKLQTHRQALLKKIELEKEREKLAHLHEEELKEQQENIEKLKSNIKSNHLKSNQEIHRAATMVEKLKLELSQLSTQIKRKRKKGLFGSFLGLIL